MPSVLSQYKEPPPLSDKRWCEMNAYTYVSEKDWTKKMLPNLSYICLFNNYGYTPPEDNPDIEPIMGRIEQTVYLYGVPVSDQNRSFSELILKYNNRIYRERSLKAVFEFSKDFFAYLDKMAITAFLKISIEYLEKELYKQDPECYQRITKRLAPPR